MDTTQMIDPVTGEQQAVHIAVGVTRRWSLESAVMCKCCSLRVKRGRKRATTMMLKPQFCGLPHTKELAHA